jgi:hypothetical protein
MSNKIDTTVTDKIIIGRVSPHIYAFSTPFVLNALKVGDTYRHVSKRIDEWKKTYPNLKKEYEHTAVIDENRIFRDFEVHKFLINNKKLVQLKTEEIDNGKNNSKEFFENATIIDLDEAISDIKSSAIKNDGKYKFYSSDRLPETFVYERGTADYALRPNQKKTVERFSEALSEGHSNLLMYAVMRFGKSFTAMCCALDKKLDARLVVVLSAKADVETEWKITVETHKNFLEFDFINKSALDENNSVISDKLKSGRRIVVFLTLQDLRGDEIKERHKDIFSNKLDLLIIDETHFGARAPEYGKVLKTLGFKKKEIQAEIDDIDADIVYNPEVIKDFKPKVSLHLSGTPYRILMGDEFKEEQIIAFYQFIDIVEEQKDWDDKFLSEGVKKEWENPYYGFPQMIRFAFNPNKSSRDRMKELRKNGKTNALSYLFRPISLKKVQDKTHKKFLYEKEILDLFQAIDGSKSESGLLSFLNYDRIIEGKLCRHIVCVLPFKASCDALEKLIIDNSDKFLHLNKYEIINISGVDNESLYPNIKDIKNRIKTCESEDKKTITLTVNRMLTGTTVPEWDTMFYFKDTASPQEYDQSVFRLQNQYIKTYKSSDKDEITKVNMKPQTLLIDFDPDRLFHMQIQKSLFYNINTEKRGNDALDERIKKELEISPIICSNMNKLEHITPTNIIDAVRKYSQNRSIFDEASDVPYDSLIMENKDLRELISSIQPIDAKKGLEIKPANGDGSELETEPPSPIDRNNVSISETNNKVNNDDENKIVEKQLAAYRLRVLFYAFLTKSKVSSLKGIIESVIEEENIRILNNVGINVNDLILMEKVSSPQILNQFEWKIKNINDLGHDEALNPIERALIAMKKFARVSDSEVVMPLNVANDLVGYISNDKISKNSVILDLASKQGELAVAIYQKFGKEYPYLMLKVYSITTSPLANELTRKVYESLNLPLQNILHFNSFDIIDDDNNQFIEYLKFLQPNIILAGPPFHRKDGGGRADSGSGSAIYHEYFNLAKSLNPSIIAMVLKASWYSGGKGVGLKDFRRSLLDDKRMAILHDYPDPTLYFESPVSLRGGVCTFLWDADHNANCNVYNHINDLVYEEIRPLRTNDSDILIRYNIGISILKKVSIYSEETLLKGANSRDAFDLQSNNKDVKPKFGKGKHKVYLAKGKIGFIVPEKIPDYQGILTQINRWKVLVAKASPGFDELPHSIISEPLVSEPGSLCTDTHLLVRFVNNKLEAENLKLYMKTKFFRFMMLLAKNNHNMSKDVFQFVPLQNLNKNWTDNELYLKYKLNDKEIKFIESIIKGRN